MRCIYCPNPAEIKCSCPVSYLCSPHFGTHIVNSQPHPYELLNLILSPRKAQALNQELTSRIQTIQNLKATLSTLTKSLINVLKDLNKSSSQKLNSLISEYLVLINRGKYCASENEKIEKILRSKLKQVKIHRPQADENLINVYQQEFFKEINACEWRKKRFLREHTGGFKCGVISEDNTKLVTGSEDCTVRVWDLTEERNLVILKGHTSYVWCLDLAPGSKIAASGSLDGSVRVWNLELKTQISALFVHSGPVFCIQFLDQFQILSAGFACGVVLWDYTKPNTHTEILKTKAPTYALILNKSKNEIFCGSGKLIFHYSLKNNKLLKIFKGHNQAVKSLTLSSTEDIIISGSNDKKILIWKTSSGSCLFTLEGHTGSINSLIITHDNNFIISASDDSTLRIWSISSKTQCHQISSHQSYIYKILPYKENFLILSHEASISLLDLKNNQCLKKFLLKPWIVRSEKLSNDFKHLYYTTGTKACIWSLLDSSLESEVSDETGFISCIDVLDNRKLAVIGSRSRNNNLALWDMKLNSKLTQYEGHAKSVFCVQIQPGEENFASGSGDTTIKIWNIKSSCHILELKGHADNVYTIKFTSNSQFLVSGGKDKKVIVWDLANACQYAAFNAHNQSIWTVNFTNDDQFVISGDPYEGIRVWSLEEKKQVYHFTKINQAEEWLKIQKFDLEVVKRFLLC